MENEIFGLDLPADLLVPELARPGFVCYRDAAGVDSEVAASVPRPEALGLTPSTFSDSLCRLALPLATYLMRGPGQRCIPVAQRTESTKTPTSKQPILIFLADIAKPPKKEGRTNVRLSERRVHCGLGVLSGYDQRVLLGGAVIDFVAGFQGHPRPGLWRAGLASLGDPNTLEDDEAPVASD